MKAKNRVVRREIHSPIAFYALEQDVIFIVGGIKIKEPVGEIGWLNFPQVENLPIKALYLGELSVLDRTYYRTTYADGTVRFKGLQEDGTWKSGKYNNNRL